MRHDLPPVFGNTDGLTPSQIRRLRLLHKRRVDPQELVSSSLGFMLAALATDEVGREVGVLLDRSGRVVQVVVGTALRLDLPSLTDPVPGLRLVHAHPDGSGLRRDDLTNLTVHRLDAVVVVRRDEHGHLFVEHAVPTGPDSHEIRPYTRFTDLEVDTAELWARADEAYEERLHEIQQGERAILVVVASHPYRARRRASELRELARTAGLSVARTFTQVRPRPDPRTLVGAGKLEEILLEARHLDVDLIVFDPELTPAQAKAITDQTDARVIDRTMLILDIFAQHASTREAKLQVELAQLRYRLPHLSHRGTMMSRLMGGIGGRGPGETKLEIDRRRVRERIAKLERRLEKIGRQRELRRRKRKGTGVPTVAIVGYTNVGKSTLLTALTGKEVLAEDKLFATLSPRVRRMRLPSGISLVLTDTVGFIEDLPHDLRRAFKATLEEMNEADLILHVMDVTDPDMEFKKEQVEKILQELGLDSIPRIDVYNKCDLLDEWPQGPGVYVSAVTRQGLDRLREEITRGLLPGGMK